MTRNDARAAQERPNKAGVIHHYALYKSDAAEDLAMDQNMFIEQVLMLHMHRKLSQREYETYRDPFRKREWRLPLKMWAAEVGLDRDRPYCDQAMEMYNDWLLSTQVPILEIYGKPVEVSEEYDIRWRAERLTNHSTAFVGIGLHFIQEDQPEGVGRAIGDWYRRNLAPNRNIWMTDAKP